MEMKWLIACWMERSLEYVGGKRNSRENSLFSSLLTGDDRSKFFLLIHRKIFNGICALLSLTRFEERVTASEPWNQNPPSCARFNIKTKCNCYCSATTQHEFFIDDKWTFCPTFFSETSRCDDFRPSIGVKKFLNISKKSVLSRWSNLMI